MAAPADAHEWVSFEDPVEDRTWLVDVTFLSSPWQCIFGNGCQGVLTADARDLVQGCCSYGAHFSDERDDRTGPRQRSTSCSASEWQFHEVGLRDVDSSTSGGEVTTTRARGRCVHLPQPAGLPPVAPGARSTSPRPGSGSPTRS